jgi:hypothetical protein
MSIPAELKKSYPAGTVVVNNKSVKVAELTAEEVEKLWNDCVRPFWRGDKGYYTQPSPLYWLTSQYFPAIIHEVRVVKEKVGSSYGGTLGRGKELAAMFCKPSMFTKNGAALTTWLFTATAGLDWFISGSTDAPIELGEDEGLIFLGWADPIETPKADSVQLEKGGDLQLAEVLPFMANMDASGNSIIINKTPWYIYPKEKYRVQVRYFADGDDRLQPIGFKITTAEKLMAI